MKIILSSSLMPSAKLEIEIDSYHRNHRRWHSPPAFWEGTP
jgi:hypothetical protein